jgi:hypothetical protein
MSGTNFGLNDSLEYTEFEFDSFDTDVAYNQNYFTTDWPLFQLGKPLTNVAAVKVLEAQIPFTYYLFNSNNNTFILDEWVTGGTVDGTATVTIPPGNYTSTTILTILGTLLSAASTTIGNMFTYTVTYNAAQMTLTIKNNDTTSGDYFTLTFGSGLSDNGSTNPRLYLGFSGGVNKSTINSGATGTEILTGPSVIQLTGPNYVYINSRSLGGVIHLYLPGNGVVNPGGAGADGPQIAKVSMTSGVGGVCDWQDPDPLKWFDVGNTLIAGNIDFYCTLGTANYETPLEFNGAPFSIKLGVLTNTSSHNDWLGGGKQNDRIVQRTWPTGTNRF